jgi:hypothetical protein
VAICHSRLAWLPYRYINLLCARLAHRLCSSRLLLLAPMCVVQRIVDLSRNPQAVQKHRKLPRCGHHRPLLGVLAATGGYLFSVATEVRVGAEGTQDVVGAANQKLPQHLVAFLGYAFLGVPLSRAVGSWHEPQVRPHRAALFEAVGVLQGKHERERRQRPYPLDLAQELRFGVMLFAERFQLSVVLTDTLGERADLLEDRPKGWPKRLGDVLGGSLVEAPCRALGQASPEGLHGSPNVVHELRAAIHQRLPRADQGYVGLALFAPVLERIQELRINPSQAGQVLGVYLVGLALIGV